MKKDGILHPGLCELLAATGHTDYVTICDRGFPVPLGPQRIDLALVDDIPTVLDVLRAVSAEWSIDRVIVTQEMTEISPERVEQIRAILGDAPLEIMPHQRFKQLCATARATVRTADTTPYANIIIVSG
jgi:D-ribose pyranase